MSNEVETEIKKEQNSEPNKELSAEEKRNLLFGAIQYTDDDSYEKFLSEMNINQAVFILIASANFAQAKGSFNLLESEVLATAIRTIKKTGSQETKS